MEDARRSGPSRGPGDGDRQLLIALDGDPLDTVQDIVGGTGGQLAAALAVGAALVGSVLRFNAMQLMGAVGVGIAAGARADAARHDPLVRPPGGGGSSRRGFRWRHGDGRRWTRMGFPEAQ